jgi:hypothetical protein
VTEILVMVFQIVVPCSDVIGQHGSQKRLYPTTSLHGVITQKTTTKRANSVLQFDVHISQMAFLFLAN